MDNEDINNVENKYFYRIKDEFCLVWRDDF